jgi:hypothetical protein
VTSIAAAIRNTVKTDREFILWAANHGAAGGSSRPQKAKSDIPLREVKGWLAGGESTASHIYHNMNTRYVYDDVCAALTRAVNEGLVSFRQCGRVKRYRWADQ